MGMLSDKFIDKYEKCITCDHCKDLVCLVFNRPLKENDNGTCHSDFSYENKYGKKED